MILNVDQIKLQQFISLEYNVITFNVEEQDEEDPSENYDADTALDIMNSAGLEAVEGEYTTERSGGNRQQGVFSSPCRRPTRKVTPSDPFLNLHEVRRADPLACHGLGRPTVGPLLTRHCPHSRHCFYWRDNQRSVPHFTQHLTLVCLLTLFSIQAQDQHYSTPVFCHCGKLQLPHTQQATRGIE